MVAAMSTFELFWNLKVPGLSAGVSARPGSIGSTAKPPLGGTAVKPVPLVDQVPPVGASR